MSSAYKCQTKCFYRNRLWVVGEVIVPMEGEKLPKHFVQASAYKKSKADIRLAADPKTLLELNKAEQAEALRAVGHAPRNAEEAKADAAVSNADADQAFA
jgi:hypothetical protein